MPFVEVFVQVVGMLREKGEVEVEELLEASKGRRRTLYRVLEALKMAGLVTSPRRGVYRWFEADVETYTEAELNLLKPHWKNLWNSIMLLTKGGYRLYGQSYDAEVGRRYLPDLESHLKTGYPEIYELYEKLRSLREQRDRMMKLIEDEVKALAGEEFKTVLSTFRYKNEALQNFATLVIDRMRDVLTEGSLWMDEDRYWEVKEDGVWCGGRLLLPPNGSPEGAKKFIVEQSQRLLESYREVFKLEGDIYRVREELNSKLDDLAKRIESGLHLRGRCKTCEDRPRIVEG